MNACLRSRLAVVSALDEVKRQPSPEHQACPCRAEKRVYEGVGVSSAALGVEQLERRQRMSLRPRGVEVAVDGQLRMTSRLDGALARGCRESLLATRDRRRAAFA